MIHARDLVAVPAKPAKPAKRPRFKLTSPTKAQLERATRPKEIQQRPAFRLKAPEPKEAQVMRAVRQALQWHRAVAHVWRINSGGAWLPAKNGKERPVKFHDIEGCSDLIGLLKDGRFLAVECKRLSTRAKATSGQIAFLECIRNAGGVAFIAASADEAIRELNAAVCKYAAP